MSHKPPKGRYYLLLKHSLYVYCLGTITAPFIYTYIEINICNMISTSKKNIHTCTHTLKIKKRKRVYTNIPKHLVRGLSLCSIGDI